MKKKLIIISLLIVGALVAFFVIREISLYNYAFSPQNLLGLDLSQYGINTGNTKIELVDSYEKSYFREVYRVTGFKLIGDKTGTDFATSEMSKGLISTIVECANFYNEKMKEEGKTAFVDIGDPDEAYVIVRQKNGHIFYVVYNPVEDIYFAMNKHY